MNQTAYLADQHGRFTTVIFIPDMTKAGVSGYTCDLGRNHKLKIYHDSITHAEKIKLAEKVIYQCFSLAAFERYPGPAFAWPLRPLFSEPKLDDDYFIGYAMKKIFNFIDLRSVFTSHIIGNTPCTNFFLARIASTIASHFNVLHSSNILVGDVNHLNIVYSLRTKMPHIIDCDSFQFSTAKRVYTTDAGWLEFATTALRQRVERSKTAWFDVIRTQFDDEFALAVIIFQLLMRGYHPFSSRRQTNLPLNIDNHAFAYHRQYRLMPPQGADLAYYDSLPSSIKDCFEAIFYQNRSVSARQWILELEPLTPFDWSQYSLQALKGLTQKN